MHLTEGIPSRPESLPRELTPRLGMPATIWVDPETHAHKYTHGPELLEKDVAGTIYDHIPWSQSFLKISLFDQPHLDYLRILFGWCGVPEAGTSRRVKVYERLCQQSAAFSLSSYALGRLATTTPLSSIHHVCFFLLWFCSLYFMFSSISFHLPSFVLSFIFLSWSPLVPPCPPPPTVAVHLQLLRT